MINARSLALLVVFGCVFAILGLACWGSVFGFGGSDSQQPNPALSAQANVSFTTQLNENLQKLDPRTCDAGCYAKEAFDTYISYKTGYQQ